ncbi:hypothetical protein MalM25_24060 [Planctomycetes bacterium MalM25]|nr:hypothetical protein MalM25_24060 [Planctomycetes bacterium MalM25]
MPSYSNHLFRYDHYEERYDEDARSTTRRSDRATRRRSKKRSNSTPSMTINGRRGRRWSW